MGFYTNLDNETKFYYINKKTVNNSDIVLECINEMLISKYSYVTFYAHDMGKYDGIFIIKILLK